MRELIIGRPLWLPRGGRRSSLAYGSLNRELEVDVAIIGGGITGSIIAAVFADAGLHVGLVEAGLIGHGSTVASTALLLREPDAGIGELAGHFGLARAVRIWQLSTEAARGLVRSLRHFDVDCDLTELDSVYYTTRLGKIESLRAECRRRQKAGLKTAWLTPGALRRLTGISGYGGIRSRNAQCNPYLACVGLSRAAARSGAAIFEQSAVRRVEQTRTGVRVVTARGSLQAAQVIIATGYTAPPFLSPVGRFRLRSTYVLATRPLDRAARRELGLEHVMLWDTERPYHYARWTPGHALLLGGADRPAAAGRARQAAFRAGTRELTGYFKALFPALLDVGIDVAWDGLFAMTPDGLPYFGPHQRYPRHLFALSYGGNGMTFSFLAARMLLERFQGLTSPDHDLFAFGRNHHA